MAHDPAGDGAARAGSARIPNFFRMNLAERVAALHRQGLLDAEDIRLLTSGGHTLSLPVANKMIENVIGVFGLPLGVALNFLINGRDCAVPLVVEEPSVVAGLSGAGRITRLGGGFVAEGGEPLLIGQVQAAGMQDAQRARQELLARKQEVLALANSLHPKMLARGGGARDLEAHLHRAPSDGSQILVAHLLVDTRDAMGANLVNAMCEGIASLVEAIVGGKVFLRILSNLADRAIARARVRIPVKNLEGRGYGGEAVRTASCWPTIWLWWIPTGRPPTTRAS